MKYLDEYRDAKAVRNVLAEIERTITRPWTLMEVCGGQTHSIIRHGLDQLLPDEIELVHGPGCPVCVTPLELIDKAIALAGRPDVIFTSYGDMLRVPGTFVYSEMGTQANDHNTTPPRGAGRRQPVIRGWDGTLTIDKNKDILFTPVRIRGAKKPRRIPIERGEDNVQHWKNLLDCARAGTQKTWSPMDLAFRTQTVLQMATLSLRQGKVARFDPKAVKIVR